MTCISFIFADNSYLGTMLQNELSGNDRVDAALITEAQEIIAKNDASQATGEEGADDGDDEEPL